MSREALEEDLQHMRAQGHRVDVYQQNRHYIVIVKDHTLKPGHFNQPRTDVLMLAPEPYPRAQLDMFWTEQGLLLADGRPAERTEITTTILGQPWRRWSRHTQHGWQPGIDNVLTHWSFTQQALLEAKA